MKKLKLFLFIPIIPALSLLFTFSSFSYAEGLMVTPTRVIFKDNVKASEVRLINKGNETTTYRISLQHLRMTEDGVYEEIKDNNGQEKFVDNLVRYSPKQVTLKPGEVQTIRLMVTKPANLESGEYRSHLLLKEEAPADFGNNIEKPKDSDKKISVILKPLFAISLPVIVRHGDLTNEVVISDAEVKDDGKILAVKLARTGNSSIYNDIVATFTPKNSRDKYDIALMNSFAVFYPYNSRTINLPINMPENVKLGSGSIDIRLYTTTDPELNKNERKLLSQKTILIN